MVAIFTKHQCNLLPGNRLNCTGESAALPNVPAPRSPGLELIGGNVDWCSSWSRRVHQKDHSMMERTWQQARHEAGLPPLDAAAIRSRRRFMLDFYGHDHNGFAMPAPQAQSALPPCAADSTLVYVPIWKAGSAALIAAAQRAMRRSRYDPGLAMANGSRFQFSFVREPLEHFLSGAAEAAGRLSAASASDAPWRAEDLVHALLDARLPSERRDRRHSASASPTRAARTTAHRHYWPMSSVLPRWRLDFVGKLEAVPISWAQLRAAHCAAPAERTVWGSSAFTTRGNEEGHDASADSLRVRAELLALFRRQPGLRRAVCTLLTPDYRCFGYSLSGCLAGRVEGKPLKPKHAWAAAEALVPFAMAAGVVVAVVLSGFMCLVCLVPLR